MMRKRKNEKKTFSPYLCEKGEDKFMRTFYFQKQLNAPVNVSHAKQCYKHK